MEKKPQDPRPPDEIVQPAKEEAIPALVEFTTTQAWEAGFDDERIRGIGLAVDEALRNILEFARFDGDGEIRVSISTHDSGAMIIHIVDNGAPFNMLLAGTFPEVEKALESDPMPSTKVMKKAIKNIEYIRGTNKNMLIFTVSPLGKVRV